MKQKTIGLALGGGGARGLAHIGVIKVLIEAGFKIDYIAGTSMGALVGAVYAATGDLDFLEKMFESVREKDVLSVHQIAKHKDGVLFKPKHPVEQMLEKFVDGTQVENCRIPFTAVATDATTGLKVLLDKGDLIQAVRASTALPTILPPVTINGQILIDGGLIDPVPADVVKKMGADYVIAVDVSKRWPNITKDTMTIRGIKTAVADTISAFEFQLSREVLKKADLVIRPLIEEYTIMDFAAAKEIITAGENEATRYIRQIRKEAGYPELKRTGWQKFLDFLTEE
jgi:NTE family protein